MPKTACVRAYPTHQRHDIVWVWMGDADKADPAAIFDLPQMSDPGWYAHQGDALQIKSNYMNVADNLVDPAHVAYVHPTTLGNASHEAVPVDFDVDSDPIAARRWIRDAPPIDFLRSSAPSPATSTAGNIIICTCRVRPSLISAAPTLTRRSVMTTVIKEFSSSPYTS